MKLWIKITLATILIPAAIGTVAWLGTFFYWHIRVTIALRTWEREGSTLHGFNIYWRESGAPPTVSRVLESAGCRALPYMVATLDDSRKPWFRECLAGRIEQCMSGSTPRGKEALRFLNERWREWDDLDYRWPASQRDRLYDQVAPWWHQHGDEHHQWWRIWSRCCHPWPAP